MSTVLDRSELEQSPLADLHLLANELGVDGYRRLRREELIDAIAAHQSGAEVATPVDEPDEPEAAEAERRRGARGRRRRRRGRTPPAPRTAWRPRPRPPQRGGRDRRGRR